jgi:hypothetical protein
LSLGLGENMEQHEILLKSLVLMPYLLAYRQRDKTAVPDVHSPSQMASACSIGALQFKFNT